MHDPLLRCSLYFLTKLEQFTDMICGSRNRMFMGLECLHPTLFKHSMQLTLYWNFCDRPNALNHSNSDILCYQYVLKMQIWVSIIIFLWVSFMIGTQHKRFWRMWSTKQFWVHI